MDISMIGAWCFGAVLGWVTYRTLRRKEGAAALSDIAAVIGALGGATVVALFKTTQLFGAYSLGLFVGFFTYFWVGLRLSSPEEVDKWMGK
jgi:hypothetical protein